MSQRTFGPVDLRPFVQGLAAAARDVDGRPVTPVLLLARLGDLVRDAGGHLPAPARTFRLLEALEPEAQGRLALLIEGLQVPSVTHLAIEADPLIQFAHRKRLLTVALVRTSGFRLEELARGVLDAVQAPVAGETTATSKAKLERLDYERLLAAAEVAKKEAEGRAAKLRAKQEEQDAVLPRRGKW